ncbi:NDR1/HIN1-like protein 12 [Abrus precatorius]|uniref:NDR1/HIN1-like protein 12 n=1 Tax=Abrus precatorius TaxID=3816 RepID=A0A8B8L9H2_ABRPR|nr:NDR1/HIN1-like protein 12 [Abrus precatorius]
MEKEKISSAPKRAVCTCITIFLLLVGITLLVLWLVYRPHKPRFVVVGAAIYGLNTTTPPLMSATMQFTVLIRNPNRRVSVYYDRFSAFVSYRNQAITPQVLLPPLHQEKHSTVSVSPVIGGTAVPVSVEVSNGLMVDEAYGVVGLKLIFEGRVRWKAGAIKTAHYGLYVKCDLLMGFKKGFMGQAPLLGAQPCDVDV